VKAFGAFRAVDGVSLSFMRGETIGVVGPNGAGKTTLFGLISGAHRVTSGRVRLAGSDVTSAGPLRRARQGVSRTFQTARIFPALTVQEHLLLALPKSGGERLAWSRSRNALPVATSERLDAVVESYGLGEVLYDDAANLPQAYRKILDLAMALLADPKVLLLDEPTAGVAADDLEVIQTLLASLREQHPDITIIVSSHDADLIARLCSRIAVLVRGQLLVVGATGEVVNDPAVRAAYFGTVLDA
jgi:branched-chain amino acid transport system ATP-binding protein